MKKFLSCCISAFFCLSCTVDYEFGESNILEHDRLVINALLNPTQPLEVYFYAIGRVDTGYVYSALQGVRVLLKENDKILFDGVCSDTVLRLPQSPLAGANYSIEASYAGMETASASAYVPEAIDGSVRMEIYDNEWVKDDLIFYLSDLRLPAGNEASLFITAYGLDKDGEEGQYGEIYASHALLDLLNRVEGMPVKNPIVGSMYYDGFLRVKNKNLPNLDEIAFMPLYAAYDTKVWIKLLTASKEYDQYCRTLYQQKAMIIYDDDISAIVYQPIQVYSNIKNGMGIFAGINEINYYFDVP
ncbi:MAG: DUF4249 domain-containing protein [Dysgonamonadaceae bacterium]|jgi:hypothetical protein|nr:DUF4249 domain-containing protein [Dysgonamonadaceae bacterium]